MKEPDGEEEWVAGDEATVRTELAVVRAVTTIDEDGDAAWRVFAASSETHTLRQVLTEWHELAAPPVMLGEGVGLAAPLLFVAAGPRDWVYMHGRRLRREVDDLLRRLHLGETDLGDEQVWLERTLARRGARFDHDTWRALALRSLLGEDELHTPGWVEGSADDRWLFAFYAVPEDADAEELEGLAGRALEAWLAASEQ